MRRPRPRSRAAPVLHLHRAPHADALVDALGELLAAPLPDPLATEVVAVPTRGMERWLAQRLSLRLGAGPGAGDADGVCANVDFPPPRRLLDDVVATAVGLDPREDPWRPERSVWPLLHLVDAHLGEPWLGAMAGHLGGAGESADPLRRRRRFASVRHVAGLFDRYALLRPDMVRAWADGEDVDAAGAPLGALAWQAELWRRLRAEIGRPDPASRRADACGALRAEPGTVALPERLACFGLTRVPPGHVDVLEALAEHRDVHLLLLHPSPALWQRIAADGPARTRPAHPTDADVARVPRREDDATAGLARNRLLASWGRDARELQLVVGERPHADRPHASQAEDAPATLLGRLQADVRADREPPGPPAPGEADPRPLLHEEDRSVRVHACHGRARQVEVLRDAILHALAEDPTLEPRDVVVLCPDIEAFAPLIHATFGAAEPLPDDDWRDAPAAGPARPPDLRVRLADRALRQTNPLLGVLARLLELAEGRVTASDVVDLADRAPVRRRFRLDDDDVARLREWTAASGVRWGLDAEHRAPFRLDRVPEGTWTAGLDRLLLGAAMTEDDRRRVGHVLPLDDVESGALDLAGRLAELVDRLGGALDGLRGARPAPEWAHALREAATALTDVGWDEAWQAEELDRVLDDVAAETSALDHAPALVTPEVRALLAERLQGRPTRANFRTGHLTMCTLVPMRSVPHRVVCLLGLDDGAFPRRVPHDGDDLVLADPHVGDREGRAEDRQMLLDALLAAGDRLIVTHTGADERTNAVRPPAVPVGELLDACDRTARSHDGEEPRKRIVVRHPLQPFDPRNFADGALVPGGPWGFDEATRRGAAVLARGRTLDRPFLEAPLPPLEERVVELEDLVRFVERPVRAFLRRRLGVGVGEVDDELADALPIALDPLEEWRVGQDLLDAVLAGVPLAEAVAAERARGTLPPGELSTALLHRVGGRVGAIAAAAADARPAAAGASVDVRVPLAGGRVLAGTVADVREHRQVRVAYSRVGARQRLAAWVRFVALTAADPERPTTSALVGRLARGVKGRADATVVRLPVLGTDPPTRERRAREALAALLDLHDRGMREPLPLSADTSLAWAQAARAGTDPVRPARDAWESGYDRDGEDAAPEHVLVAGGRRTLDDVLDEAPGAGEDGDGWVAGEDRRLGRLARRLWDPLLDHEETEHR